MVEMDTITVKQLSLGGVVLALLIILPLVIASPFGLHVMILIFMFAMCGVAWNLMGGYAGMFSFGQAAFFGIGAYTSSYLLLTFNMSPWIGLVAGGIIASLMAAAIGYPMLQSARPLLCHCQHCFRRNHSHRLQQLARRSGRQRGSPFPC